MKRKPFIAGGYSKEDWDILNGSQIDSEFLEDYCITPSDRWKYVTRATKPNWLK